MKKGERKNKKISSNHSSNKKDYQKEARQKINELEKIILNAQKTILDAQRMINQLKEKDKSLPLETDDSSNSSFQKISSVSEEGEVIYGTFDGQVMIGANKKQYPVPANYASKSKLIEGDQMKLTITQDGRFIYKQVGPAERKYLIGIAKRDSFNNLIINAEGKDYRILPAAATYFKIETGDEVTIVVPRFKQSVWAAIENVVKKSSEIRENLSFNHNYSQDYFSTNNWKKPLMEEEKEENTKPSAIEKLEKEIEMERKKLASQSVQQKEEIEEIENEWIPDLETLKKEVGYYNNEN